MLDQALKQQVVELFSNLKNNYTLQQNVASGHANKQELNTLLEEVASCSDKLSLTEGDGDSLSFTILKNDEESGIYFKAVPNGHEFTSLLLAVLNFEGIGKNLPDEAIMQRIKNLNAKIELKSYISLSCTNCPQVVQALNIMAMVNPNISHEIIDGALHKEEIESLKIQAVPTVFLNGEQLHIGRASLGELLAKIEKRVGQVEPSQNHKKKNYDVVVVGGGPAGVSAAIYSARKGFSVALIAEKVGGQVVETVSIENMISVPKTTGAQLASDLMKHLSDYPIDVFENRRIESFEIVSGYKQLTSTLGEVFSTPALIVATGASWKKLGVPGEEEHIGAGVAFCTHCDGPFYKNKKVVVVGGGNSGLEAAIDLSAIASEVTVLEFMDELKGDKVLQEKIQTLPNVDVVTNAQTLAIDGDGSKVNALKYKNRETEVIETLVTDGVFVQVGLSANSGVFSEIVETNRMGEIEIDAHCRTKQAGVYAAGDVSVVPYKQIVIAMGEGSKAALSAFEDKIKNKQLQN